MQTVGVREPYILITDSGINYNLYFTQTFKILDSDCEMSQFKYELIIALNG